MSGIYDVTLAPGAAANIAALGSFCKVLSAPQGSVSVKLDGGESFSLLAGQGVRLPDGKSFRDVAVINKSSATQLVLVFVGDSRFEDTRITGIVSVTNLISANMTQLELSGGVLLPIAFLATPVLAIASNPRGVLVRRATVFATAGAGGSSEIRLVAAPSIPVVTVPISGYNMAQSAGAAGVAVSDAHQDQNFSLPATWGVWCVTQHLVSAAAGAGYSLGYEPL